MGPLSRVPTSKAPARLRCYGLGFRRPITAAKRKLRNGKRNLGALNRAILSVLFKPLHQVDNDDLTIAVNFQWRSAMISSMSYHMDAYYLRRLLSSCRENGSWKCACLLVGELEKQLRSKVKNLRNFLAPGLDKDGYQALYNRKTFEVSRHLMVVLHSFVGIDFHM